MVSPMRAYKRLALVPLAALAMVVGLSSAATASSGVPYRDPNAAGVIGLCDRSGHQITHGDVTTRPFAWRAVSSLPARAPYNAAGATATLYAYQPRQDVAPGDWSGSQLTASARFSNPAHPMAAATSKDISLSDFIGQFAPMWDGLLQLRIFLGAPNQQVDSLTYPATTIQVTGKTWHVIDPEPASCASGTSESIESILLPASKPSSPSTGTATSRATATASSPSAARATTAPTAAAPTAGSPSNAALQSSSSSGGHTSLIVTLIVVGALLLAAGGFAMNRRSTRGGAR
jgi:hypothetical protein